MATVNKRTKKIYSTVLNGIDAGGPMSCALQYGWDNVIRSSPDGLSVPVRDREIQFVRGSYTTQDWILAVSILTGTVGTFVFYERKSGVAEATGYVKHTINNPVVHSFRINISKGVYAGVTFNFECRPADETEGIAEMWVKLDAQAAPTYIAAARGGWRVKTAVHGAISIYHTTAFSFGITMQLIKACNDGDVGYTCVDAEIDNMVCDGSITIEDSEVDGVSAALKAEELVLASAANLVVTLTQSGGAADKVITIANVEFDGGNRSQDASAVFNTETLNYEVANDPDTPLTLEGTNKIITIV